MDWDKWVDEDEEDEAADKDMGFDLSQLQNLQNFGAMGGMEGMAGMGGAGAAARAVHALALPWGVARHVRGRGKVAGKLGR